MRIFNFQCRSSIIAEKSNWANFTARPARLADLASDADDIQVRGEIRLRREQAFEIRMCLFNGHLLRAESDAARHAVNVCIHREGGHIQ